MTVMTAADRQAVELYAADLQREFDRNYELIYTARALGDKDAYIVHSDKVAALYRELSEIRVALKTGPLPLDAVAA